MRAFLIAIVFVALVAVVVCAGMCLSAPIRIGTFNIENCPKSPQQLAGALNLLKSLEADAVGIQEIRNPALFSVGVKQYLGEHWGVVYADQRSGYHRVGLVYDRRRLELRDVVTHWDTIIVDGARATLEVRFEVDSRRVRVFVVHLKAGGRNGDIRLRQLAILQPILSQAVSSGEEVVLLGDFNATGDTDREALERFAEATDLRWSSKKLACTSYWRRARDCPTSSLDHIFSSEKAHAVEARGACETVGCEPGASCPLYVERISDHCPVTADW